MAETQVKFVIISMARCGTTFLVDLLDSHPDIYCDSEILPCRDPAKACHAFYQQHANGSVTARGFKVLQHQNKHVADHVLLDPDIKKLVLYRSNHMRQFYSVTVARRYGVFHARSFMTTLRRRMKRIHRSVILGDCRLFLGSVKNLLLAIVFFRYYTNSYSPKPLPVSVEELQRFIEDKESYFQRVRQMLESHRQPYIEVCYEDLLSDNVVDVCNRIQRFIGVSVNSLTANTRRLHVGRLPDLVANYEQIRQQCQEMGIELE